MRRHLPVRLAVCAALAGSASLAAVAIPGGVATASPLSVTCTTLTGNATSQTISGCTGTGAITADAGTPPAHGTSLVSTKTITWSNHKTTKESYSYTASSTANCPSVSGYAKLLRETIKAGSKVVASSNDAAGMVGGALTGTFCVYKKGSSTILVKNLGTFKI